MSNFIYIAQSLDGYIADKDGGIDWLNEIPNPEDSDFGFGEFMNRIDAVVMGRKTFESVMGFDMWIYTKPVYVVSASHKRLPEKYRDKAEILNLRPAQIIEKLKIEGRENLYIDGGALIQGFLAEDLIDELIITTIPILLGGGISLFGKLQNSLKFRHVKTEVLIDSMVKSYYQRER
ncbi:MAG: dihydrofolate reductase family protein [Calditrichaceae bacterium]